MNESAVHSEAVIWDSLKLPLPLFIECTVTGNLTALAISGTPTDEELKEAWLSINNAYSMRVNEAGTKSYCESTFYNLQLQARILQLTLAARAMQIAYSAPMHEWLTNEGIDLDFDGSDPEAYARDIERLMIEVKSDEIELSSRLEESGEIETDEAGNPKPKPPKPKITEDYFLDLLAEISYCEGYRIKAADLTTEEFCSFLARMKKQYKRKEAAAALSHPHF